jgi:hypothetical protein
VAGDAAFSAWWSAYLRMGASPGAAVALTRMNAEIDIRDVLPSIRVPTLVMHRTGDRCLRVEEGRYLASRIPGATFIELPGIDHLPFVGDQDALLNEVENFLSRGHHREAPTSSLATVIAVAARGSASELDLIRRIFERECQFFRGRSLSSAANQLVSSFDGPGRAVQCALSVVGIARQSRIDARAGVHIGAVDATQPEEPVSDAAAAMAAAAPQHEVHASRTVVDLLAGSGFSFAVRDSIVSGGDRPLPVLAVYNTVPEGESRPGGVGISVAGNDRAI